MARRPRLEPVGIPLHVIGRGCRGIPVLGDDTSRSHFLHLLNDVVETCGWRVLDWVLMSNHHHLVVELREQNLAAGMQRLHGLHAVDWNRRHSLIGHAWMGRYSSVLLDTDRYQRNVLRYVALNPVRAGLCAEPGQWRWSGYAANAGLRQAQPFHDVTLARAVFRHVLDDDFSTAAEAERYRRAVTAGLSSLPIRVGVESTRPPLDEVIIEPTAHAIRRAAVLWGYSTSAIAAHCGISERTVQRRQERARPTVR